MRKPNRILLGYRRRNLSMVGGILVAMGPAVIAGCDDEPPVTTIPEPCTTSTVVEHFTTSWIDKLDILISIDNSRSMADKQALLAREVAELVESLVNPRCIDEMGTAAPVQPSGPLEDCPTGTAREFAPILDVHVGVITSSIGGHGADSCPNVDSSAIECAPNPNTTQNDHGQLIARQTQCGGPEVPTFQNKKFLAWDPINQYGGETTLDNGIGQGLLPTLRDMVVGAGSIGCDYESQLESVYRFLIDPEPYETITVENFKAVPSGIDAILLEQRASFLRPDSILAVVMLSDENDCSIREAGQYYYVGQHQNGATAVRLPRARQECAIDPNDPCCKSCGQAIGSCPEDPTCTDPNTGTLALLTEAEDHFDLRCWDQKRRFGIDFLYPLDRYVKGFSETFIANRFGEVVLNPLFNDLDANDNVFEVRDPSMIFFAGIVGVPWQDIARDPLNARKGFKNADEMATPIDGLGATGWDVIVGEPTQNQKPLDPLMWETYEKRVGTNPITGEPLVDSTSPNGNAINGHERTIAADDLQYACIFDLPIEAVRDCSNQNLTACDCKAPDNDSPLCVPNPIDGNSPTIQTHAKAYPAIRQLSLIRSLSYQGILGSTCPAQTSDSSPNATDFGYRPAIRAVTEAIGNRLVITADGGCWPHTLVPQEDGSVMCAAVEARTVAGECNCDPTKARLDITEGSLAADAANIAKKDPLGVARHWNCFCEIPQLQGAEMAACQNDYAENPIVGGESINGWCYVDTMQSPAVGSSEVVAKCPDDEKRLIRFVGDGNALNHSTVFVECLTSPPCEP